MREALDDLIVLGVIETVAPDEYQLTKEFLEGVKIKVKEMVERSSDDITDETLLTSAVIAALVSIGRKKGLGAIRDDFLRRYVSIVAGMMGEDLEAG